MHRLHWSEVPLRVREVLAGAAGGPILSFEDVSGGFSPCLAGRAQLGSGQSIFIKAVSSAQNPDSPGMVRRELELAAALPAAVPAPRLRAVFDDGDWVAGIFDCVEGEMARLPWDTGALSVAFGALDQLAMVDAPSSFPTAAARLEPLFDGWRQLADTDQLPSRWVTGRLDELIAFERHSLDAVRGNSLVHADIRADNIMFTVGGEVVFVDWAHACAGPPWLDAVLWLPALQLEGAGLLEENIVRVRSIRRGNADAITAVLVACAGYFVHRGTLPDPPGLPTLRGFQRAQGEVALAGLRRRLG